MKKKCWSFNYYRMPQFVWTFLIWKAFAFLKPASFLKLTNLHHKFKPLIIWILNELSKAVTILRIRFCSNMIVGLERITQNNSRMSKAWAFHPNSVHKTHSDRNWRPRAYLKITLASWRWPQTRNAWRSRRRAFHLPSMRWKLDRKLSLRACSGEDRMLWRIANTSKDKRFRVRPIKPELRTSTTPIHLEKTHRPRVLLVVSISFQHS